MAVVAEKNERRALLLLRLIDDDARAAILATLPENLRKELKDRIRLASSEKLPSARKVEKLLNEFHDLFDVMKTLERPRPKLHRPMDEPSDEEEIHSLTGNTRIDLEHMNLNQLAAALNEEHPRTVALLMSEMSSQRVASLMQTLATGQRQAVAKEMTRSPKAPNVVIDKIAASTVLRATSFSPKKQEKVDSILRMADVFREIDKSERRELLDSIREENPDAAVELQKALYRFDDLLELEDRTVQAVLAQVDSTTLQDALFGASTEILDKILTNLSRRAAATLREELAYQRTVPDAIQKSARQKIASVIGEVDEETSR